MLRTANLLYLLENFSLERKLFFVVTHNYDPSIKYSFIWDHGEPRESRWLVEPQRSAPDSKLAAAVCCSSEDLIDTAIKLQLSLGDVASGLVGRLLSEAAGAKLFLEAATPVLGQEAIDDSVEAHKRFTANILSAVNKILGRAKPGPT